MVLLDGRGQQLCGRRASLVHHQDHRDRRLQEGCSRSPHHLHLSALQHLSVDGHTGRQQGVEHVVEFVQVTAAVTAEVQYQHPHSSGQQPCHRVAHVAAGTVNKLVQPDVAHAAVQQFALENGGNDDWSPGHRDH